MTISLQHTIKMNEKIKNILSKNTGQSYEKISNDINRDYWLTSEEALKYGLIDKII